MKISVVIPVYNAAQEIAVTLEHLLRSDYRNFEVICVDDASTDQTCDVVTRFPVRLERQNINSGAARARNRGSRVASGEILFFIDADVRIGPEVLGLIADAFAGDSAIAALVGAYTPEQPVPSFYAHYQNFYTFFNHDKCLKGPLGPISWFWTACGAIRRSVFEQMGGFREIYIGASAEDMDLGYRLSDAGYTILLNKKIEVVHAHHHSFKTILRNNIKKAAAWGELYLRKNWSGRYKHGFTSTRNYATMVLVALLTLALPAIFLSHRAIVAGVIIVGAIILINQEFYRLMCRYRGVVFLIKAIPFHILATFCAGLGGIVAIFRRLTGREGDVS
ncbi:glycosyltransferase family 2 protein [bacterium]|nr:glycosyltransferase family 2 protein [bacterium]